MISSEVTIVKLYNSLSKADVSQMRECYDPDVEFCDPAFGTLNGKEVFQMWQMLIEKSKGTLKIDYSDIHANDYLGSAKWITEYKYSKNNHKVLNTITSKFVFKEGLIIKQTDDFDVWKWSKQALGIKGVLLGWTGFMQKKIQKQARLSLKQYSKET